MKNNQLIALDWLKNEMETGVKTPMETVRDFVSGAFPHSQVLNYEQINAYVNLSDEEEFEVLLAFAEYGLKEDER